MPGGKAAGERCVQLLPDLSCAIFGKPQRPAICGRLRPEPAMCGTTRPQALAFLAALEAATAPG